MKYSTEVTIDLPRERVIELFDSFDNLVKWQPGLRSYEHLSGTPGEPGAKTRLRYDEDGREMEMIETVLKRDLPDEFTGTYEAKGVYNWVSNRFYEAGPDQTRWVLDTEFKFSGLIMTFMGIFMRGSFPKRTLETMNMFKAFAEKA